MSGPSTLRICLAAMAPALTEAASARLRLQDTDSEKASFRRSFTNREDNRPYLSSDFSRSQSVQYKNLKALGGRHRSKGEVQVTHLSLAENQQQASDFDTKGVKPVALTSKVKENLRQLTQSAKADSIVREKSTYSPKIESPIYVSEDFQEKRGVTSQSQTNSNNLRNQEIMNQPVTGIDKIQENVSLNSNAIDNSILNDVTKNVDDKFIMIVQSDNDLKSPKEKGKTRLCCDEKGDASSAYSSKTNSANIQITPFEGTHKKESGNMGVVCTGKEPSPSKLADVPKSSETQVLMSQMLFTDAQDKSRDDMRKECARKQVYLERKAETLLRRLKRMRGKVVETHAREQLRQYVNHQHQSLQQVAKVMRSEAPGPAELKEHFLSNDEVKSMSTTELVKLVRTYQPLSSSAGQQKHVAGLAPSLAKLSPFRSVSPAIVQDPALRMECGNVSERLAHRVATTCAELDSDATASSSGGESADEEEASTHEGVARTKNVSELPPLVNRAEWRWAADRAGIVSRWTWLQAQVSDLEYRIRQQSQVHRQLRASKGGVVLGDPPSTSDILRRLQGCPTAETKKSNMQEGEAVSEVIDKQNAEVSEASPCNIQAVMSNVDRQASRLKQSLGNCLSPASSSASAPNSVVGSPRLASPGRSPACADIKHLSPNESSEGALNIPKDLSLASRTSDLLLSPEQHRKHEEENPNSNSSLPVHQSSSQQAVTTSSISSMALDTSCQSARCRPLRSYRKRRILRTIGLHRLNAKAARLSEIRCRCSAHEQPCPMCGGRRNNTVAMDVETMSLRERVGLIDSSFHPVLSFPWDTSLSIHCEGLLRSGLWQNKPAARKFRGAQNNRYIGQLVSGSNNHKRVKDDSTSTVNHTTNANAGNNQHHKNKVLTLVETTSLGDISRKKSKKSKVSNSLRQSGKNNGVLTLTSAASVIKNFSEKIKSKYDSKTKSKSAGSKTKSLANHGKKVKKKTSKVAKANLRRKQLQMMAEDEDDDDLEALYLDQEVCDTDTGDLGASGGLSASASQSSLKDIGHYNRKRRVDNSYDINNIVIPLSMATSVPVEQPQYKEIVTPKWREIQMPCSASALIETRDSLASKLEKTNGVTVSVDQLSKTKDSVDTSEVQSEAVDTEGDEMEDLSDEMFASRHLHYEMEEKKRFRNFVQYPPLRRNRARSDVSLSALDTRCSDKSECLVQEESSVSRPTTPVLMKSLPSGRLSLEEAIAAQRQRTVSLSGMPPRRDSFISGSSAKHVPQEPWPVRSFPLSEIEVATMLEADAPRPQRQRHHSHNHGTRLACSTSSTQASHLEAQTSLDDVIPGPVLGVISDSVALSPQSASASASSTAGDDAGDPEWLGSGAISSNVSTSGSNSSCGSGVKRSRTRRTIDDPGDPDWLGSDTPRKARSKR